MAKNTVKNAKDYNKAARARYSAANRKTLSTKLNRDLADEFAAVCAANGETANAVIKRAIEDYIRYNSGI